MIVFESMFGNSQQIAQAIEEGLREHGDVTLVEVGAAAAMPFPDDLDLLVVGGPTHALSMSRPGTREEAAHQATGDVVSRGIGIREWLASLPDIARTVQAAAFDTKLSKPSWLPGSASHSAAHKLKHRGVHALVSPESFYVEGVTGPLAEGELARARRWGESLAVAVSAAAQHA